MCHVPYIIINVPQFPKLTCNEHLSRIACYGPDDQMLGSIIIVMPVIILLIFYFNVTNLSASNSTPHAYYTHI